MGLFSSKKTAQPATSDSGKRQRIVAQVCRDHQADGLQPHEVIVKANGEIWIDRRRKDPRNVPFHVGNWS